MFIVNIGLINNLISIVIQLFTFKRPSNLLQLQLAFSDISYNIYLLIVIIFNGIFGEKYQLYDFEWRNSRTCFFLSIFSSSFCLISMFSLLFITYEKLAAVKNEIKFLNINFKQMIIFLSIISSISITFSIIPNFVFENYSSRFPLCFSLHLTNEKKSGWFYSFLLYSILPIFIIFIILYLYMQIFKEIHISSQILSRKEAIQRISSVLIIALLIVTTNIITWIPIFFLSKQFYFRKILVNF